MKANLVGWFEIYVQDMERAKAFYEAVFQGALAAMDKSDAFPDMEMQLFPMDCQASGAAGALVRMTGVPSGGNSTLVYFSCNDCAVEAERAVAHGGSIFKEKMAIGEHGFIALVFDTEGNMIGLHSMN